MPDPSTDTGPDRAAHEVGQRYDDDTGADGSYEECVSRKRLIENLADKETEGTGPDQRL